jgi:hypothetical protein
MGLVSTAVGWLRRLVRPPTQAVPRSWLRCPICDRELVGPYPSGTIVAGMGLGEAMAPNRSELIAKCPVHGHRPFNDPDVRPPFKQVSGD